MHDLWLKTWMLSWHW